MVALPLRIRAVFREGKFVPHEPCSLPESSEVDLLVESPRVLPPTITDPNERARVMDDLIRRMQAASLSTDAPQLTRDEMHERR